MKPALILGRCTIVVHSSLRHEFDFIFVAFCYPVITRWGWHDNSHFSPNDVGWLIDGVSVIPGAKYQVLLVYNHLSKMASEK